MSKTDPALKLLLNLTKVQAIVSRSFDSLSAHGISFSDFMILYLLSQAPGTKMRRVDLAEKTGLTASGVTRMLVPLEKIGLIQREANERDARVSYASLTATGRQIFEDALVTATHKAREIIPVATVKNANVLSELLSELGGNIV
jgi:DNA-binding MarR family transcriptional regulator